MKKTYSYTVLEGSARDIGRESAKLLKRKAPEAVPFFCKPMDGKEQYVRERNGAAILEYYEKYFPGLNEELEGFAEEMGIRPEESAYYTGSLDRMGLCSHFAVTGSKTGDGGTYVGRSYEWSFEDDLNLTTVRIPGRAAHTGFSIFLFGRLDGINEHGLCVTISAGNPGPDLPGREGFLFWPLVRTVLDRCRTIEEGRELMERIPMSFHLNMIITEESGRAALIEKAPDVMSVKMMEGDSLFSTNHYTLPGMEKYAATIPDHSLARWRYLDKALKTGAMGTDHLKSILSQSFPEGLSARYFSEYFGTLWSMVFDLGKRSVDVCFGPPDSMESRWRTFSPTDPAGIQFFEVDVPETFDFADYCGRVPNPAYEGAGIR